MIFDDMLNKLKSFQSKQDEVIVKLLSTFENHFYSGKYNFKLNNTYDLLKIAKNERLFDDTNKKIPYLCLAHNNFEIKYCFDTNYPEYFKKYFVFRKKGFRINFYFNCDISKKEEILTHIVYGNASISIQYNANTKKLKSNEISRKEITYYDAILKNIEDKNLRDFLLICHDLKIEKNDNYDCFINLLNHVQTSLDINNHLLNIKNIGIKNDI